MAWSDGWVWLAVVAVVGCEPDPGARADTPRALVGAVVREAPPGGDGPTERAWGADGAGAVVAVAWADATVVLDGDGDLWRVTRGSPRERLARGVSAAPAVADDGRSLGYFVGAAGERGAVHVRDGRGDRVVARDVQEASGLRFIDDGARLLFVAVGPGGVVGLHTARTAPGEAVARCWTNCALRTGEPWGDGFVPVPADLAEVRLEGAHATWTDDDGRRVVHLLGADP